MSLEYKISEVPIAGRQWKIKEFLNRDQFPIETEKDSIGHSVWGADVPESLWPLSGILWPSGVLLAQLVASLDCEGQRILELGCGVGLASLVLKSRGFRVIASDYNSFAGELIRENAQLNSLAPPQFQKISWQDPFLDEPFDLVIGSDVLYEPGCAEQVCRFLEAAVVKGGSALFVDPGRAHVRKFEISLQSSGFDCQVEWPQVGGKTRILRIRRHS